MREKRNAHRLLVGKPEGRRPLGRPRRRWVDDIRMDLLKIFWRIGYHAQDFPLETFQYFDVGDGS
jgi:hypothetical protein